eukprot:SAG11_NODE_1959_length_3999_cov_1.662308_1_plen_65_part_00
MSTCSGERQRCALLGLGAPPSLARGGPNARTGRPPDCLHRVLTAEGVLKLCKIISAEEVGQLHA